MKRKLSFFSTIIGCLLFFTQTAQAIPVIAYEWTPGANPTNSGFNSFHNTLGPVLADDFTSAATGSVIQVDWWGSQGVPGSNQFEITFHSDSANQDPSWPYLSQHFTNSAGSDADGDGVFDFTSLWNPQDLFLVAGQDYWFSVADGSTNNWVWANAGAGGPTVGTEQYDALQSIDGTPTVVPGPHDGPWLATTTGQDFAFRVWVDAEVPEPGTFPLLAMGMLGFAWMSRKNSRKVS